MGNWWRWTYISVFSDRSLAKYIKNGEYVINKVWLLPTDRGWRMCSLCKQQFAMFTSQNTVQNNSKLRQTDKNMDVNILTVIGCYYILLTYLGKFSCSLVNMLESCYHGSNHNGSKNFLNLKLSCIKYTGDIQMYIMWYIWTLIKVR